MKTLLTALSACAIGSSALGAVSYTGGLYSEDFNLLPTTNTTGAFSGTVGVQSAIPGPTGWDGAKIGGTSTTNANFIADAGTSTAGALYSYGATGTNERALGSLASGTQILAFGVELVNNTSDTFDEFVISFDREQWRSSTSVANILTFAYGLSGGSITSANYLTEVSMTLLSAGNLVGDAPVATNGALNPPSVVPVAFSITGLNWAPGQSLFLRWSDFNDAGNDAGLAIDNFVGEAIIPTPGAAALLGLAGLVGLRRRR